MTTNLKNVCFGAAAAALLLSFAGCSNPADTSPTPTSNTPATARATVPAAPTLTIAEPAEPKDAMPTDPAKKNYVIGVSLLKEDDDFYKALMQGLQDQATK